MHLNVHDFKQYLAENPIQYPEAAVRSLLELFCDFYSAYHPIDGEKISLKLQSLEPILRTLSRKRKRKLYNVILALCKENADTAFIEGIHFGAQLLAEIYE